MPTGSSTDDVPVKWKFYVPMQFLLRSVDTGRRMCNVGASTTSGISRSYRDVDLETNEARVVEFPPRKHTISQVCNTLQTLRSTRRQEDEHDGFGNFIACALRRMADIDMRRARTLRAKLLAVVQEEESSMDNLNDEEIEALLEALVVLLLREGRSRLYVNEAHAPFLDTRFRMFDSYLCSMSPSGFYSYVRLHPQEFENLHERLARRLSHFTSHRAPIPSRHRLCLFLRLVALFVAHGTSYAHLSGEFAIGHSTACTIAHEVAHAIVDELHDLAFPIPTPSTWRNAVEQFRTQWDYPAAMGALDGKHIACVCPSRSGSSFFNYKGHYSIVLLALVDANYRCILYDLGASGRSSDAGVFMTSPMKTYIEEHDADFPSPVQLGNIGKVPCHFLVDQGFRLTTRFIRPYSDAEASSDSKSAYFNFKLSRARRVVENYFGILANRFRILLRPIYATPENIKTITMAIMILHNLLVASIGGVAVAERYGISEVFADQENVGAVGNVATEAKNVREMMKNYFSRRDNVK
ncbi:unnamed protein product [Nippostrongylus brasiliensis]|uniref:DDE Tnp4 domain-containing protein n=1 Tax=Nippostrongylus brasiliensis TaxID=27835 RepID=A0A0N4YND0_NIPBR|nr:unnamed protein product [Nippostrongylus brasiliensis]